MIILTPAFVSYKSLVYMCGATMIDIPYLATEDGFAVDMDAIRKAISPKTKMLILNSPSNPTGAVLDKQIIEELCRLALENNFLIFSDEIYSRLVYGGKKFTSVASVPGMKDHCIVVSGFSKTFAMTGWRIGYLYSDAKLVAKILKTHQYSTTCSPTFIMVGLADAMETDRTKQQVQEMIDAFARRRELVMSLLDEIDGLSYVKPYGAFYILVDISKLGMSSMDFSLRLLEEKFVATVPAVGLDDHTGKYVRISYATSESNIKEGLRLIAEFVKENKA